MPLDSLDIVGLNLLDNQLNITINAQQMTCKQGK